MKMQKKMKKNFLTNQENIFFFVFWSAFLPILKTTSAARLHIHLPSENLPQATHVLRIVLAQLIDSLSA